MLGYGTRIGDEFVVKPEEAQLTIIEQGFTQPQGQESLRNGTRLGSAPT